MTEKAKPKKHKAKELAAKADAALINWGIVKTVEPLSPLRRGQRQGRGDVGSAVEPWAAVISGFAAALVLIGCNIIRMVGFFIGEAGAIRRRRW
ncbi:hypothetical protein CASFOL_011693 [Castilleja foliolosa]|uniref:Uncharacterized protein n=1 Tax=Castilleja foliolosa TaxID=1961234 RepID=A0ABD3DW94_9LAMI